MIKLQSDDILPYLPNGRHSGNVLQMNELIFLTNFCSLNVFSSVNTQRSFIFFPSSSCCFSLLCHPYSRSLFFKYMLMFSLRVFALSFRSCPTLCDPVDGSPAGASDHGVLQARILEWVAMPSPGDLPNPGITLDNCKVFSPTSHSPIHCSSLLKAMIFYSS